MEYLVKKKVEEASVYYLVKWRGRQHRENTWILADVIKKSKNGVKMINDLEKDWGLKQELAPKKKGRRAQFQKFRKRTVQLGELEIHIPSMSKNGPNWMYGDKVEKVISREDENSTYKVLWSNGAESIQEEESMIQKQPKLICLFLEGMLNIRV